MMARYGKVERSFWHNRHVRALSRDAREMLFYLFTTPHGNGIGCFVLSAAYASHDLKTDMQTVEKAFEELLRKPFITRDLETDLILIMGWWGHNTVDNPNTAKSLVTLYGDLPDCAVKSHAIEIFQQSVRGYAGVRRRVVELFNEGFANTEQEQEQEQDSYGQGGGGGLFDSDDAPHDASSNVNGHVNDHVNDGEAREVDRYFGLFWEMYPRKVAKEAARKAFPRALQFAGSWITLREGLKRYRAHLPADPSKICHAATWLNGRRWDDEPAHIAPTPPEPPVIPTSDI